MKTDESHIRIINSFKVFEPFINVMIDDRLTKTEVAFGVNTKQLKLLMQLNLN